MGLSTLFATPVFGKGKIEGLVRWLFVASGILGTFTPIA